MATNDDLIRQMYENNLASTKTQLETDYNAALGDLDSQKAANQQAAAKAVTATKTEADRAAVAGAEYAAASGLSSGARAQARMARDNQLASDLTAIRTAQMDADAEIERKRGLLAQDYAAAISKAQADNDLALAEALYKEAQNAEDSLRADQRAAADLLAKAGDFTRYGQLYGLTDEEVASLRSAYLASLTKDDEKDEPEDLPSFDNGSLSPGRVNTMLEALGLTASGMWTEEAAKAAGGLTADEAWTEYQSGGFGKVTSETTLSDRAKKFMSTLPYMPAGGSVTTWKGVVNERLEQALKDGEISDADALALMIELQL